MLRQPKIMMFCLLVFGCGEATEQTPDAQVNTIPSPGVRDMQVPRRDMRVQVTDMGVPDAGTDAGRRMGSQSTFIPGEYIPYGFCPELATFGGQMTAEEPGTPNGGQLRLAAYPSDYDSGLRNLIGMLPAPSSDSDAPPVNVNMTLNRVTVVATRPLGENQALPQSQGRFWVADANGSIEVYLGLDQANVPPFPVHVGQVMSMRVTQIGRYGDKGQIRRATDWIEETAPPHPDLAPGPNAEVSVLTPVGPLSLQDVNQVVRVTGLLQGEADNCGGGHACWTLNYGEGEATYRSQDENLREGTCITFVGPLSSYRENLQLEPFNPAWARRYQRGNELGDTCEVDSDCTTDLCLSQDGERTCGLRCETQDDCPATTRCSFGVCLPQMGSECPDEVTFIGQYEGEMSERPNGGIPRFEPHPEDYDAGIARVISEIPPTTVDGDPAPRVVELPISRATVVATRAMTEDDVPESQGRFWVADGRGRIEVRLDLGSVGTPNFAVRTGQVISFTATQIGRYQGKNQISGASDWIVHPDGEPPYPDATPGPHAEVYVYDVDRTLERSDVHQVVRLTGRLEGGGDTCGSGHRCWDLDYGFDDTVIFRTTSDEAQTGRCVTYVGPMGIYRGNLQVDTVNLDWLRVYN